jgi:hypothetical protein
MLIRNSSTAVTQFVAKATMVDDQVRQIVTSLEGFV